LEKWALDELSYVRRTFCSELTKREKDILLFSGGMKQEEEKKKGRKRRKKNRMSFPAEDPVRRSRVQWEVTVLFIFKRKEVSRGRRNCEFRSTWERW